MIYISRDSLILGSYPSLCKESHKNGWWNFTRERLNYYNILYGLSYFYFPPSFPSLVQSGLPFSKSLGLMLPLHRAGHWSLILTCQARPPRRGHKINAYKYWADKHRENRKTLPREHLIGCQGVKMFLLKDPFKFFSSS